MATFIAILNFTDQGIRNIKDTTKRADAFVTAAEKSGVSVRSLYWTLGAFDGAIIFDAPTDAIAASVMAQLGAAGNVRTQVVRAFDRSEIAAIVGGGKGKK